MADCMPSVFADESSSFGKDDIVHSSEVGRRGGQGVRKKCSESMF
jgi:hypothetical protein